MRRLPLFFLFTILQVVLSSCPDGLELTVDGQCIKYYGEFKESLSLAGNNAIAKCKDLEAQPVIIHNQGIQSYWAATWTKHYIILGLVCNTKTSQWQWSDGSAVDYKPAAGYHTDLDGPCKSGCFWSLYNARGDWYYNCGSAVDSYFIYCTAQIHPDLVEISDGSCTSFEDDQDDDLCYQVDTTAANWNNAQMICRKMGANLASVHNLQENSFLRRLAVAKGAVDGIYLGATISGKGGNFGWIDGSDWDYDNFIHPFPIPGVGDCVIMDTSTTAGSWVNAECSGKLPFACVRDHARPEPSCSSEPVKEGSIVTSPDFPYSASTPCDYYLMVDEGKKVAVELTLLEANSCCDFLIFHDGYFGGALLANLTGEIHNATYTTTSSNIMHVSWQPKGGVNVMGMALTFRGV